MNSNWKIVRQNRSIVDLSAPNANDDIDGINYLIYKELFSHTEVKVDDAMKRLQSTGQGSLFCKVDLSDAL